MRVKSIFRCSQVCIGILLLIFIAGCRENPSAPEVDPVGYISVPPGPGAIAIIGDKLFVTSTNYDMVNRKFGQGYVTILDAVTDKVLDTLETPVNPQDILISEKTGMLFVACTGNYGSVPGSIAMIDPGKGDYGEVSKIFETGGSPAFLAEDDNGLVFAAGFGNGLITLDPVTGEILSPHDNPVGFGGSGLIWDGKHGKLYMSVFDEDIVEIIEPGEGRNPSVTGVIAAGDGPQALFLMNDILFVLNGLARTITWVDTGTMEGVINAVVVGQAPNSFSSIPGKASFYVVCSLSNDIYEIDPTDMIVKSILDVGSGTNPMAVVVDRDGDLYVTAWLTGEVLRFSGIL